MSEPVKSMIFVHDSDNTMTEFQFRSVIRLYPDVEEVHVCAELYDTIGSFASGMHKWSGDRTILAFDPGLERKPVLIRHHPIKESF